jgi:hypothetical protein
LYKGLNKLKRGYQARIDLVKDENGILLTDFHCILNRWKNYFCQLLQVYRINYVRQAKIYTGNPFINEPIFGGAETAIGKLKMYKSPCTDQILPQ